jgi:hypothetical protein
VTRVYPLWALFGIVVAASLILSRRRGIAGLRLLSAWGVSSLLLWLFAGILGYAGGALLSARSWDDPASGFTIGAALGALVGAPLGIALSERALWKSWPRWPALALATVALLVVLATFLGILKILENRGQEAGSSVFVVFPLLGAAAVLGWLLGGRRRMVDPLP